VGVTGSQTTALGLLPGCLKLAPGELRRRDSASEVARRCIVCYAAYRRVPGPRGGHREEVVGSCRTRQPNRLEPQGCPRPVEGPMGSRAVCERQQRVLDLIEDRPGSEREGRSLALLMTGPKLDRAVVAARGECVAIGGEGQAVDLCGVT